MIQAAVIGLGVGEQHARAWALCQRARLIGVYDRDTAKKLQISRALKTGAFQGWGSLVRNPAVDAVSIATFDQQHARQVRDALKSGKHVFVEKPLCRTAAELKKIRKAWVCKKPALMANLVLRTAPLYRKIQQMIDVGKLGKIYAMDGDYLYGRIHKITDGWRSRDKTYSVMAGGGVHLLDLILGFVGEKPHTVTAAGNRICTQGSRFRQKDFVSAVFEFPSGLIARLTANFGCMHRHQHSLRIFGTRGTIFVDDVGARWHRSRRPDAKPILLKANRLPSSKGALIPYFVSVIGAGSRVREKTAEQEFTLAECLIAADRALTTGKQERISG
jgi:predicted dehydrogenase